MCFIFFHFLSSSQQELTEESLSLSSLTLFPHQIFIHLDAQPCLLQAEWSQLSQFVFICQTLQSFNHPHVPLLDFLPEVPISLASRSPDMDPVFQMCLPNVLLMRTRTLVAFFAKGCMDALTYLVLLTFPQIPSAFSAKLLSSQSVPSQYGCVAQSFSTCRTWHFSLSSKRRFPLADLSSLLSPL